MRPLFPRCASLLLFGFLLVLAAPLFAQALNFQPLERGEYTEEEQKLFIMRGIETKGAFGISMGQHHFPDLEAPFTSDKYRMDFRLNLRTVFHREMEMQLNLEPLPAALATDNLRTAQDADAHAMGNGEEMVLHAREAYLRYRFNPRSSIIAGKQEISIGDRRGKVLDAILPALTYDCTVGTWCFPVGMARSGPFPNDWIFHWALQYTAWDQTKEGFRDALQVEIFRIFYNETNVPLGTNRGPATTGATAPTTGGPNQAVDSTGAPIFYQLQGMEYFGFRVNWESGKWFVNFDATLSQGRRRLHADRATDGTLTPPELDLDGTVDSSFRQKLSGVALESEIGYRRPGLRMGVRLLSATGDPQLDSGDELGLSGDQNGYYEIVPGTYRGTRFYFNGTVGDVGTGGGLGHSVNNTRMFGYFLDYSSPVERGFDYKLGIYQINLDHPIDDEDGNPQDKVGLEIDNMFSFYLRPALTLDVEINLIQSQGALRVDDFSTPLTDSGVLTQGYLRLVYRF